MDDEAAIASTLLGQGDRALVGGGVPAVQPGAARMSMPALDLALMVAAQRLKRLKTRPDPKKLLKISEPWRPFRSYGRPDALALL